MTVYIPDDKANLKAHIATVGYKFCQDQILLKSFLDQRNIEYDEKDLEMTPFGLGLRIKKEEKK